MAKGQNIGYARVSSASQHLDTFALQAFFAMSAKFLSSMPRSLRRL